MLVTKSLRQTEPQIGFMRKIKHEFLPCYTLREAVEAFVKVD